MNRQEVFSFGTAVKERRETQCWEPKTSHLETFLFNFEEVGKVSYSV